MFAVDDKPSALAGKCTTLHALTAKLYQTEIEDFYAKKAMFQAVEKSCIDIASMVSVKSGLHDLICKKLGLKILGFEDDLFSFGLDSLSVLRIEAALSSTSQDAYLDLSTVTASLIYTNQTIERLSDRFGKFIQHYSLPSRTMLIRTSISCTISR
jgi:hypothetical protein